MPMLVSVDVYPRPSCLCPILVRICIPVPIHNHSAFTGQVMSDYKVHVGRQEFNTKCSYDAVQGFEHLLSMADSLGIDVHSIAFTGGSAGGGEINYLTYVYHSFFSPPKYSPRSMVRFNS